MREAFLYQVALKILDWILDDTWPRALVVVPLALPLILLKLPQSTRKSRQKAVASDTIASTRGIAIPNLPEWGKWVVASGWLFLVWVLGLAAYDAYQLRVTESHLSWQAREFYEASCMGRKTAPLNPNGQQRGVEAWMPTYRKYGWRLQQVMLIVGHHELIQKGIIEDRPLDTYSDEKSLEALSDMRSPNIISTPFGNRLCAYFLTKPSKAD